MSSTKIDEEDSLFVVEGEGCRWGVVVSQIIYLLYRLWLYY